MEKNTPPQWLVQIDNFADDLNERANRRKDLIYSTDIEYMEKAARLLKIMTVAYYNLSNQINLFYERQQLLKTEAEEVVELVEKQMKVVESWPEPEQEPPHIQ